MSTYTQAETLSFQTRVLDLKGGGASARRQYLDGVSRELMEELLTVKLRSPVSFQIFCLSEARALRLARRQEGSPQSHSLSS